MRIGDFAFGLRKEVAAMSREMMQRMKTAGEYHRKAVRALFPEKMRGHLDVIEKEMKMMLLEMAADAVQECRKEDVRDSEQEGARPSGARKVDIM